MAPAFGYFHEKEIVFRCGKRAEKEIGIETPAAIIYSRFNFGPLPHLLLRGERTWQGFRLYRSMICRNQSTASRSARPRSSRQMARVDPEARRIVHVYVRPDQGQARNRLQPPASRGHGLCLFQLHGATKDPIFLESGDRAIGWLKGVMKNENDFSYPKQGREVKLGGAGLALLALVERTKATGERKDADLMDRLARFILWSQRKDGSFRSFYLPNEKRADDPRRSIYYPGEVLLALARLQSIDPKPDG